ncbi:MAG TPA: FkbM family methyltransferase [Candidatus Acidoferrales bacterium]|nr:FkbM family methyltransferase [Candidatus Acidoferrales bacterium]
MVIGYYLGEDHRQDFNGEASLIRAVGRYHRTFIDVGANVGDWTNLFIHSGGQEKPGALIEPSSSALLRLRARFQHCPNVQLVNAAASDRGGEMTFYEQEGAGETSSLVASFAKGGNPRRVIVTTVDDEAAKHNLAEIDFLKIDAEGYDFHCLVGSRRLLSGQRIGIIQFEYGALWADAGSTLAGALDSLRGLGYETFLLRSSGLLPCDYRRFGEFFSCSNFVSVAPSKRDLIAGLVRAKR